MYFKKGILSCLFLCLLFLYSLASDTIKVNYTKKVLVGGGSLIAYTGSLAYLNYLWYQPYRSSQFHFFNDNGEWFKMDKWGHSFTAFYATHYLNTIYQWAGIKHSAWWASAVSFSYLLNIEILDGFSSGWGFSTGDLISNTAGIGLFWIHHQLDERLFVPKFSFYPTRYAAFNLALLGQNFSEQIVKDYNGQIYWLSITPFYQWKKEMEWLCLSVGYGIDGCIGARSNVFTRNGILYDYSNISRQQQFYLSIDIDLSKIKTQKKWLKTIFQSINFLKIPAPTLEWKGNNLYFRPLLMAN